jgi:transposase
MLTVEMYAAVRRAVYVEGISEREAARRFGLSRVTIHKMLQFAVPPGYRRQQPVRRPKLDPYLGLIDQIIEEDKQRPKKQRHTAQRHTAQRHTAQRHTAQRHTAQRHTAQRHTAQRVFERLRDEHGYDGGVTIVKDYLQAQRLGQREMFVPLSHPAGDAQVDFGEADIMLAGALVRAHYFVLDLPHSDDAFVMAFPAETTEAFCEGHNQAFAYFGGVPRHIVYDNTAIAVARILGDGKRQRTRSFTALQSHYLFSERFARPRKGNDKGKKARWKAWSATPAATSLSLYLGLTALVISICCCDNAVSSDDGNSYVATARALVSASSEINRRSFLYRLHFMKPVRPSQRG